MKARALLPGGSPIQTEPKNSTPLLQYPATSTSTVEGKASARLTENDLLPARTATPPTGTATSLIGVRTITDWSVPWLGNLSEVGLLAPSSSPVGNGYTINMTYTGCNRPPAR